MRGLGALCLTLAAALLLSLAGAAVSSAALPYKAQLVKDINPGSRDNCRFSLHCAPGSLGDLLFLSANDGAHGEELWKSDGSAEGTMLVKDIRPGRGGSFPTEFTDVGEALFFTADDGAHGNELWRSDGTAEGTTMVKDITPGPAATERPYGLRLTNVGGTLFFATPHRDTGATLWKSDGTPEGTVPVKHFETGGAFGDSGPEELTNVAGTLFFTAYDSVHGLELWRSDGTPAGTTLVKDLRPGTDEWGVPHDSAPEGLAAVGDKLFFVTTEGRLSGHLWVSDGTAQGTAKLTPGDRSFDAGPPTAVAGRVFFNHMPRDGATTQLWRSDGTVATTKLVKRLRPRPDDEVRVPRWRTPYWLTDVAGTLFFVAFSPRHGAELWKSDGTAAGTRMVKDIRPGRGGSTPARLRALGKGLFFVADDGIRGRELWHSDGTKTGTTLVRDINPGPNRSRIRGLTAVGETLFFAADDGTHGRELWKARPLTCAEAKAALQKAQRKVKRARAALRRAEAGARKKAKKRLANTKRKVMRAKKARRAVCGG
jgi:ELWxxDGT repeat protein